MQRLYYLCESAQSSNDLHKDLAELAEGDWRIHILRQNNLGVQHHLFSSSTVLRKKNIIHTGERGALIGLAAGFAASIATYLFIPLLESGGPIVFTAAISICVMAGAWAAGMFGIEEESYKIRRFTDDMHEGKLLVIIDIDLADVSAIQKRLAQHADVRAVTDDALASPPTSPNSK